MADFTELFYSSDCDCMAAIRFQIADYGEPGKNDWHRAWLCVYYDPVTEFEVWIPMFDNYSVPYDNGNAKIGGNMEITGPPADWDETNLLEIYHWKHVD
jgi:hypothetical protein